MTDTETKPARRTGRPPLTDRATLLAAARELGFHDLTVGAVTARVGVKYSTFYRHFPSLEALVSALVDDVLSEDLFPDTEGSWQEQLRTFTATMFDVLGANPGLAHAIVRLPDAPATMLSAFHRLSGRMIATGFSAEDAVLGSSAALHTAIQPWLSANSDTAGDLRRRDQVLRSAEPLDERILAVLRDRIDDPPRDWTLRRLDLILDGLEKRLGA